VALTDIFIRWKKSQEPKSWTASSQIDQPMFRNGIGNNCEDYRGLSSLEAWFEIYAISK
jgi:hypothetical protein